MMAGSGAAEIVRGVARALAAADQAVLAEVPLANGRRADLVALDRGGTITLVEVKASRADFVADRKWQDYLDYCDRFSFAVALAKGGRVSAGFGWQRCLSATRLPP